MKSIMKIALSVFFAFTLMSGIDNATKQQVSTPVIVNVSAKKKKAKKVYYAKKARSTTVLSLAVVLNVLRSFILLL